MASIALPFLAALRQRQTGDSGQDFSGIPQAAPGDVPVPQPDLSVGHPTAPPQPPPNPVQDLSQSMVEGQGAPKLAPETKGHKLLQILLGGAKGAAAGAGQYTFGGGFQQAQMLPLAVQHQQLQNEQLRQILPFLRAQQFAGLQKTGAETQNFLAQAGKHQAEVQGMPIKQALEQAQTEAAYYKDDQNLGLIDIRTGQPVNPAGMAPLSAEEAQVLGKQPGDRVPLKLKNTANEIVNRGFTTVNTEEGVYERNRATGKQTRLGSNPRLVFAPSERFVPVADPNNPGVVTYQKAGIAAQQGLQSPQSAPTQAARTVLKSAVGGKIGDEINAFNTAMAHADLLKQAFIALNNGDVRALNSLKNRWETEMGSPLPTNVSAISNAYSREITKMLSSGHMTDSEIGSSGATLPQNASPAQMFGALNAYQALAASKMQQRQNQVERGLKGQANFPQAAPQEPTATAPNGHKIAFRNGAWVDAATNQPIQ